MTADEFDSLPRGLTDKALWEYRNLRIMRTFGHDRFATRADVRRSEDALGKMRLLERLFGKDNLSKRIKNESNNNPN